MKRNTTLLAWCILLLLCLGGGLFLYRSGFFSASGSLDQLRMYIGSFSPYSHLCFFLVQFLSVILAPIPSNITAAAGGLLFGTWPSFFLTYAAVFSGSVLVFSLARTLGQPFADRLVSRSHSVNYLAALHNKADLFLLLAFLFPFFPDDILCILAGISPMTMRRFALLVAAARPWGLLFASALGGSSLSVPWWVTIPLGAGCLVLFLLGMKYGEAIRSAVVDALSRREK